MNKNFRAVWPWLLASGVFVLGLVLYVVTLTDIDTRQSAAAGRIADLNSQIEAIEQASAEMQSTVTKQVTGLDASRKAQDDDAFARAAKKVFTWQDLASYTKARNDAKDVFSATDDGDFLTTYMPAVDSEDVLGGTAMEYVSTSTTLINISGPTYTYLATVKVKTVSPSGASGTADGIVVRYDTDAAGVISNVRCDSLTIVLD